MWRVKIVQSDFWAEWLGVGILASLAIFLAHIAGLRLIMTWRDGLQVAAGLCVTLVLKLLALRRGGMMAEYFALTAAATTAFVVLSYACMAVSGPLADSTMLAADRALRFDWMAGYNFLRAHSLAQKPLIWAYNSMVYQDLFFCVLMSLMDRKGRLREIFWMVFVSGSLTCLGAVLFPALGPYRSLGMAHVPDFVPVMEHLKTGRNLVFVLKEMAGVVSFPSFHTVMALTNIWAFRRTGIIGWAAVALNAVMLIAIPWFGDHYLVDMFAGAGVMLVSLGGVLAAPQLWAKRSAPLFARAVA